MKKNLLLCYVMLIITLLLVAGTFIYLSWFSTTEDALRSDKHLTILNGPWKFIAGDTRQYGQSNFDDSHWENMDLTAPAGVHDDDVGLSGYLPGWTAKGHANYSGYAWYRMKIPTDRLTDNKLALSAPPAVDYIARTRLPAIDSNRRLFLFCGQLHTPQHCPGGIPRFCFPHTVAP
jgi:hypothetical protein